MWHVFFWRPRRESWFDLWWQVPLINLWFPLISHTPKLSSSPSSMCCWTRTDTTWRIGQKAASFPASSISHNCSFNKGHTNWGNCFLGGKLSSWFRPRLLMDFICGYLFRSLMIQRSPFLIYFLPPTTGVWEVNPFKIFKRINSDSLLGFFYFRQRLRSRKRWWFLKRRTSQRQNPTCAARSQGLWCCAICCMIQRHDSQGQSLNEEWRYFPRNDIQQRHMPQCV